MYTVTVAIQIMKLCYALTKGYVISNSQPGWCDDILFFSWTMWADNDRCWAEYG